MLNPLSGVLSAAGLACLLATHYAAYDFGTEKYERALLEAQEAARKIESHQSEITSIVVVKHIDRIKVVKEKGRDIVKVVETLVPVGSCELPGGFRVLHDAAARGEVPETSGASDAAPADAQTVAATVAENYSTCIQTSIALESLQEWVNRMQGAQE